MAVQPTETNFALTFLQQLSARQVKYASDFTVPPSTLGAKPLIVFPPLLLSVLTLAPPSNRPPKTKTHIHQRQRSIRFSPPPRDLVLILVVTIKFTSLKPPKIDATLCAPPSQTFLVLKTRLAEETKLNPLAIRFLLKNKAISDSKSIQEVFGQVEEAQITVMVMKNVAASTPSTGGSAASAAASGSAEGESEKMVVEMDEFWEGIREVIKEKFKGSQDEDEVFDSFKRGYLDKFGHA